MYVRKITLKAAVLSIPFVTMSNTFLSPVLAQIAAAFPSASATDIQLIMTCAMLGSFPMTLLSGALAARYNKKLLVLVGLGLLLCGGLLPLVLHRGVVWLYASSLLMGAGQGTLLTMMSTLAACLFEGEERATVIGWQTSVQNGGNMVMTAIAGTLAAVSWVYSFYTILLAVPVVLAVLAWLPARLCRPEHRKNGPHRSPAPSQRGFPAGAVPIAIYILLFSIGYATHILNASMLLEEGRLAGPAAAGIVLSLAALAGIGAGVIYSRVSAACGPYILLAGCSALCAGLLIAALATNLLLFLLGAALVSIGLTFSYSGGIHCMARVVPLERSAACMGLFMSMEALGCILSPYLMGWLTNGIWGSFTPRGAYLLTGALMALSAVYALCWGVAHRAAFSAATQA